MPRPLPPDDCTRARKAASARLDDELSELEAASLEAHLGGCAECRAYAGEIAELAQRLRFAALEQVPAPMFIPSRHRLLVRGQVAAAAVLVLLATGSSFVVGQLLGSHGSTPSATLGTTVSLAHRAQIPDTRDVRRLRPGSMIPSKVTPV
jgi:predicted anti-sigma-YlaC factor YlaD